jgi:hypothetical protein
MDSKTVEKKFTNNKTENLDEWMAGNRAPLLTGSS